MNTQNIFVYGLLQSKYDNDAAKMLRKHATLIGPASIPGAVFDLGDYPAAIFEKNMKGLVHGELYSIHGDFDELIKFLDEFEGLGPDEQKPLEYHRGWVRAQCQGKNKPALCYLYQRAITHILNGDGLKHVLEGLLAGQIPGEFLITRECMIDGPLDASLSDLSAFYKERAEFLKELDPSVSQGLYEEISQTEFDKMRQIPKNSVICLWFERDLFCQTNLWFVAWLLYNFVEDPHVFLIEPGPSSPYAFNGLSGVQLYKIFEQRIRLEGDQLGMLAHMWESYAHQDNERLLELAGYMAKELPFIMEAVKAHLDREAKGSSLGRPMDTLKEIMSELGVETSSEQDFRQNMEPGAESGSELSMKHFGPIFQEFCRREAIYGYGDLQVLRMVKQLSKA